MATYYGAQGGQGGSTSGNSGGFGGAGTGTGGAGDGTGGGGGGAPGTAGGAGGFVSAGVGGGAGGAGGANGNTLGSNVATTVAAAAGGAGVAGAASTSGSGGGGGAGGIGVNGPSFTSTLTLTGAVTGGRAGDGGASTGVIGGNGGSGGLGVRVSGATVSLASGSSVTAGDGGAAGGTTGRNGGQGGEGVSISGTSTFSAVTGTSVKGGAGGVGTNGLARGGVGLLSDTLTLSSAADITGGAGGQGGAGVSVSILHGTNSGVIRGGAGTSVAGGGASRLGGTAVTTNFGDLTNAASGSLTGGAVTGAGSSVGGLGFTGGVGNTAVTLTNQGTIQGGADNTTGAASVGGAAINSDRLILSNSGVIRGGAGRVGGVGIGGAVFTITNSGTISGGASAGGGFGNALETGGGATSLTLSTSAGTGTLTGDIALGGALQIDPGTAASVTLSNVIKNLFSNGSVIKMGANTLVLTGASTFSDGVTVGMGVLEIGQGGSLTSSIAISSGATLRGVGSTAQAVTTSSGAVFAPGGASGAGTFTIGDALSIVSGATFKETLSGAASYGTANVGGQVTLGGTLSLTVAGGAGPLGTIFTLIHETGATGVTGAFTGQAEGSSITTGGYTFKVSYVGGAGAHDVTLTETAAPVFALIVTNAAPAQTLNDNATTQPFAAVSISDTAGGGETVTVTYTAANGQLSGSGFTHTAGNSAGAFASATTAQAAIDALLFTPAANQVAPGQTVQTTFSIGVVDGALSGASSDIVTATSVNDTPTLGGAQSAATATPPGSTVLQPNLTITDLDVGAMVNSARVSITGFVAGDMLTVPGLPNGVQSTYDAGTGLLTLSGAASDASYQAALRTVTFTRADVAGGARTVNLTVTDDQGAVSQAATETVTLTAPAPPAPPAPPTPTPPASTPSQTAALPTQFSNLSRAAAGDPDLARSGSPLYVQAQAEQSIIAQYDAGKISLSDAQAMLFHLVDGTTSLAEISYAFFTGATPTAVGLNYLVHSPSNPSDLNDAYYQSFNTDNRYINFAVSLGSGGGAGAAAFNAAYGSLSLTDAAAKAYQAIFGVAPAAGKISAILNEQVANGLGGTETRAQYLADVTGGTMIAQKAAVVGFFLADSLREGGVYATAEQHFLADLSHGTPMHNVDLLVTYGPAVTTTGAAMADPSVPH